MSNFHTSAKVLNIIDTRPKDNEVKGAVQLDPQIYKYLNNNLTVDFGSASSVIGSGQSLPCSAFAVFDKQNDDLTEFINVYSKQLGLPKSEEDTCPFGLMFDDGRRFVTEDNKHLIQQGFLLILTASPLNYSRSLLSLIEKIDLSKDCFSTLLSFALFINLSADIAFARALQADGGVKKLIAIVERGVFEVNVNILCQILQIFLTLMSHPDVISWNDITRKFVDKMAVYVNGSSKMENNDSLYLSLNIILNVINRCTELEDALKQEVRFESLIRHLENSDERILLSVLTLMNILYLKANNEERQAIVKILHSKPFVAAIETGIVREARSPDQRIREQLVGIQNIIVEELRNLALRLPSEQEMDYIMRMDEWGCFPPVYAASSTFSGGTEGNSVLNVIPERSLRLASKPLDLDSADLFSSSMDNLSERAKDLDRFKSFVQNCPPGSLALCAILEFARPSNCLTTPTNARFKQIQAESSLQLSIWPFILANIANSMIVAFRFCDDSELKHHQTNKFSQLILKSERPFYDIFGVMVELFYRTWREMHASVVDLDKVLSVVHDQMQRALGTNPASPDALDKTLEKHFSYFHMQKIWERERIEQEELQFNSVAMQSLREHLRPDIEELVMKQQQYWYWKLDDNERYLCYTNCKVLSGGRKKELDLSTTKKVSIFNIRRIVHGAEYSNQLSQQFGIKLSKKSQQASAAAFRYGLCLEMNGDNNASSMMMLSSPGGASSGGGEQFHLATDDETSLTAWVDGMNCIISPQLALQSSTIKAEVERLLCLEVRMHLLDVDNALITADLPVPPPPLDTSWIPAH